MCYGLSEATVQRVQSFSKNRTINQVVQMDKLLDKLLIMLCMYLHILYVLAVSVLKECKSGNLSIASFIITVSVRLLSTVTHMLK